MTSSHNRKMAAILTVDIVFVTWPYYPIQICITQTITTAFISTVVALKETSYCKEFDRSVYSELHT